MEKAERYPEAAKVNRVEGHYSTFAAFAEWLFDRILVGDKFTPEEFVCRYFKIDYQAYEHERRAMLEDLRKHVRTPGTPSRTFSHTDDPEVQRDEAHKQSRGEM